MGMTGPDRNLTDRAEGTGANSGRVNRAVFLGSREQSIPPPVEYQSSVACVRLACLLDQGGSTLVQHSRVLEFLLAYRVLEFLQALKLPKIRKGDHHRRPFEEPSGA